MNIVEALVILLLLVAVSAFVSCSELALASSRKIKLQILGKEGDVRALDVLQMQEQPGSFITWCKSALMRWRFWPVWWARQRCGLIWVRCCSGLVKRLG